MDNPLVIMFIIYGIAILLGGVIAIAAIIHSTRKRNKMLIEDKKILRDRFRAHLQTIDDYQWLKESSKVTFYRKIEGNESFGYNYLFYCIDTKDLYVNAYVVSLHVGVKDGCLYFCPSADHFYSNGGARNYKPGDGKNQNGPIPIKPFTIKLEDIDYYEISGEKHVYSTVSGGGSSAGGAIVGGLIAGGAGAIIGSRKGVTSTVHTDDDRCPYLYFKKDGVSYGSKFSYDDFQTFKKVIPEYDYKTKTTENAINKSKEPKESISEQLRQLKVLLDDGIITQEEFDCKKKQILEM